MTTATAYQASFFTNEELLPYRETYHACGERWDILIDHGQLVTGEARYHFTINSDRTDHWGMGGSEPVSKSVTQILAELKARIEYGPYERSRSEIRKELQAACAAKGVEWHEEWPE